MLSAACVKLIRSCQCVFFSDFLRPEPRSIGGAKILNEINGVNKIAVLFGAVFIPRCLYACDLDDEIGVRRFKQRTSALTHLSLLGLLDWGLRRLQQGFEP